MIFIEKHILDVEDYTPSGELSPLGILRIFENVGNHHSEASGDSLMQKLQSGISWVLLKWTIKVERFPKWASSVHVSTWTYGNMPAVSVNRDYLICDEQGNTCVLGNAKFALLDVLKRRPIRITSGQIDKYHPEDRQNFEPSELKPIIEPQQYQITKTIVPRRSDIDFNKHVHNLSYFAFAQELLPVEVYSSGILTGLKIVFKKPTVSTEVLIGKLALDESEKDKITCTAGLYGEDHSLRALVQMRSIIPVEKNN